jgi:hypothetical protein
MAENKTQTTEASVLEFLENVTPETKKTDSLFLLDWLEKVTGFSPKMWGPSIIGYGSYHYKYASGREGDAPLIGFSPRKNALTLYVTFYESEKPQDLSKLGKFTHSKACIYVKKLEDIHLDELEKIVKQTMQFTKEKYPD